MTSRFCIMWVKRIQTGYTIPHPITIYNELPVEWIQSCMIGFKNLLSMVMEVVIIRVGCRGDSRGGWSWWWLIMVVVDRGGGWSWWWSVFMAIHHGGGWSWWLIKLVVDHGGGWSLWWLIMVAVGLYGVWSCWWLIFFYRNRIPFFFLYLFRDTAIRNIVYFYFFKLVKNWHD